MSGHKETWLPDPTSHVEDLLQRITAWLLLHDVEHLVGLLDHFLRAGSFIKKDLIFDSDLELSFLLLYVEHKIAMNKSEIESHIYI